MLSAVTLSESTLVFSENLIKVTIRLIKHTPFINFGENGKDTNGTIIFDIKFVLLFMNAYVSLFQFWEKNWTEQWVIKVMLYKVRKYIIVSFLFSQGCHFLDIFFSSKQCLLSFLLSSIVEREWQNFVSHEFFNF